MEGLVARTGRHQQRYKDGFRLVAGCVPFKYRSAVENGNGLCHGDVEVLMINSTSGPGLLFPKNNPWQSSPVKFKLPGRCRDMKSDSGSILRDTRARLCQFSFLRGGWEDDETVEQAASREALEEAGVRGDLVHFIGFYEFKSKTLQDELSPEGWCRAAVFALLVKEELESWPEQSTRQRSWLTVAEAMECCRYPWMREALGEGFSRWHADRDVRK